MSKKPIAAAPLRLEWPNVVFERSASGSALFRARASQSAPIIGHVCYDRSTRDWRFYPNGDFGFSQQQLLDIREFLLHVNRLGPPLETNQ